MTAVDPGGFPALACPYSAGPTLQRTVQVGGSLSGVGVGAPVRAFHRYAYRLEQDQNLWWLSRSDDSQTDLLAGPFWASGVDFIYLDTLGLATSNPANVARVEVMLVARSAATSSGLAGGRVAVRDTLGLSVSLRNR